MEKLRPYVKLLFWLALVVAFVMAMLPAGEAPKIAPTDKLEHMIAFATLAILAKLAYPRASLLLVAGGLVGFGALIEVAQMIPAIDRDAELGDWIADGAAIAIGLALVILLTRRRRAPR